jgi:hypothetical protein
MWCHAEGSRPAGDCTADSAHPNYSEVLPAQLHTGQLSWRPSTPGLVAQQSDAFGSPPSRPQYEKHRNLRNRVGQNVRRIEYGQVEFGSSLEIDVIMPNGVGRNRANGLWELPQ